MTVRELREALANAPEDADVLLAFDDTFLSADDDDNLYDADDDLALSAIGAVHFDTDINAVVLEEELR